MLRVSSALKCSPKQLQITLFHRLTELSSDPHKDLQESLDSEQLQREASDQQTEQVDVLRLPRISFIVSVNRSAETVDSLEDGPAPLLEGSRSERAIGRSRCDEEVLRRTSRCESSSTLSTVYYGLNC